MAIKVQITPATIERAIHSPMGKLFEGDYVDLSRAAEKGEEYLPVDQVASMVEKLRKEMFKAAENLEFEKAAELRDRILGLQNRALLAG